MANSGTHGSSGGPALPAYSSSQNPSPSNYRRSSYASVLSAAAGSATPQTYNPLYRSSQLANLTFAAGNPPLSISTPHSRNPSRTIDAGGHTGGLSSSRGRDGNSYSGPFGSFGGFATVASDIMKSDASRSSFFIPSYLRGSRHAERLEEAHKASLSAARDSRSAHSSNAGSLSTSASSINLHKMVPPHRGLMAEVVERAPPPPIYPEDSPAALPSRWNEHDKFPALEILSGGLELKYNGVPKPHESEAAAVRADHPMPRECGIYYYEVTVVSKSKDGSLISIGFSGPKVPLNRLPGWEPESWAYHGDDGMTFSSTSSGKNYGPRYSATDVIGCGVNFRTGCAFFTKNGVYLDVAFRDIKAERLYPAVGVKKPNEHLRVNFGQSPFVFDIDSMLLQERLAVVSEIGTTSVSALHPPLTENLLVHRLVAQYLAHDGYVETARAFAEEVQKEDRALSNDGSASRDLEPEEDLHAVRRQKIRRAILKGDMDNALALTREYYPSVLRDNENIYFKLRCRRFVEMIRQTTELREISPTINSKKSVSNGRAHDDYNDVFNHQMELDEQLGAGSYQNGTIKPQENYWENEMDTSDDASLGIKSLEETIQYGQELKAEFSEDPRREVKKALEDTLALIAYADPRDGPLKELLDERGRVPVAEELNGAILVSLGKPSSAALERLVQQTVVLLNELGEDGGPGAFVNVRDFL